MSTKKAIAKNAANKNAAAKSATSKSATSKKGTSQKAALTKAAKKVTSQQTTIKKVAIQRSTAKKSAQLSALDVAARVLAESKQDMSTGQLIEAMAAKGYWSSPGGKTPAATLYSAILRELTKKGKASRFTKTQRGHFAYSG